MAHVEKLLVFLASPGDVPDERRVVEEVIAEVNRTVAPSKHVVLQVFSWEHDTFPGYGSDAQAIVNAQIAAMARYALFIGIMWNRLGTPTPRAASGTIEEFERAADALAQHGQPAIWFYFREAAAATGEQLAQQTAVREFRKQVEARGLPRSYDTAAAFRDLLRQHTILWLNQRPAGREATADSQVSSLLAILTTRADTIRADWDDAIRELKRLHEGQAVERLTAFEERFLALHTQHVAAIETGDLQLSHELVGKIHDLLFQVRDFVSSTVGKIGRTWFSGLRLQYIDRPTPEQDPEYAAAGRDLARLNEATEGLSSMQYPGEVPTGLPQDLADLAFVSAAGAAGPRTFRIQPAIDVNELI